MSFEKQGFYAKIFLFSERTMLYSHITVQKFELMISACNAVFCYIFEWPAFGKLSVNKHKSIFLVSKIYPEFPMYVPFALLVQRFSPINGVAQQVAYLCIYTTNCLGFK